VSKPKSPPSPVVSYEDLTERLESLKRKSSKATPAKDMLALFRTAEPFESSLEHVQRTAAALHELDGSWAVQLQIVASVIDAPTSPFRPLGQNLVHDARRRSCLPDPLPESTPARVAALVDWIRRSLKAGSGRDRAPAAMLMTALWLDRNAEGFSDVVVALLEAWTGVDRTIRGSGETARAVASLIAAGAAGRKRGRALFSLILHEQNKTRRVTDDRDRALGEAAAATAAQQQLAVDAARARDEVHELAAMLAAARADVSRLQAELKEARHDADNQLRETHTRAANDVGGLRRKVVDVLAIETEEMRLYLDRPTPNAEDAIACVGNLEKLLDSLRRGEN
jgi:hypothetical protein